MPSKSKKQARFMQAAAHNPGFARKAGISQSVAREFNEADQKTSKFQRGGLAQAAYTPRSGTLPGPASTLPGIPPNGLTGTTRLTSGALGRGSQADNARTPRQTAPNRSNNTLFRAKGGRVKKMLQWIKEHDPKKSGSEREKLIRKLREMGVRNPEDELEELRKASKKEK